MTRQVPLNELDAVLDELEYPVALEDVRSSTPDVVLQYADGEEPLRSVLDRVGTERFDSRDELASEVMNVLPVEAVGEPGQSEGEG